MAIVDKALIGIICFVVLLLPMGLRAATLGFSPSSVQQQVGSTVAVDVLVSSEQQAMNAVSGAISYPADLFELVSISKTASVIAFWVLEPTASSGQILFEGVVLNPGYQGKSGRLLRIYLKARKEGEGEISFRSGSVLANDGKGTNILSGLGTARVSVKPAQVITPTPPLSVSPGKAPIDVKPTIVPSTQAVALLTPTLTLYPTSSEQSDPLSFRGNSSHPNLYAELSLERALAGTVRTYRVPTDENGVFHFVTDETFPTGRYRAWVRIVDTQGASSEPSQVVGFEIIPDAFIRIAGLTTGPIALGILLVVALFIVFVLFADTLRRLMWFLLHTRTRVDQTRKQVEQEFEHMERELETVVSEMELEKVQTPEALKQQIEHLQQDVVRTQHEIEDDLEGIDNTSKKR